jgi:hypothetical protein
MNVQTILVPYLAEHAEVLVVSKQGLKERRSRRWAPSPWDVFLQCTARRCGPQAPLCPVTAQQ